MLIRITLALHDSAFCQQLQAVLARSDILVEMPRERKDLWERMVREPADVLIISQSLLPNRLKDKMRQLQGHPDSPAAAVLSDSADPKVHARLLAEGCDAVLFAGLAVEQVRDVIETMLEKRRRLTQKRFFAPQLCNYARPSLGTGNYGADSATISPHSPGAKKHRDKPKGLSLREIGW